MTKPTWNRAVLIPTPFGVCEAAFASSRSLIVVSVDGKYTFRHRYSRAFHLAFMALAVVQLGTSDQLHRRWDAGLPHEMENRYESVLHISESSAFASVNTSTVIYFDLGWRKHGDETRGGRGRRRAGVDYGSDQRNVTSRLL